MLVSQRLASKMRPKPIPCAKPQAAPYFERYIHFNKPSLNADIVQRMARATLAAEMRRIHYVFTTKRNKAMPSDYKCTSCSWGTSTGSSHGFSGEWHNYLYCRECGASHNLTTYSFFGVNTSGRPDKLNGKDLPPCEPGQQQLISCNKCGATGPFGNAGPITDNKPKSCPVCKSTPIVETGQWMT